MKFGTIAGLIVFRTLNAILVQSSFVPDEYWQSLEVAHRMVFGVGHLTWEWTLAIRSAAMPAMFAPGFLACSWLGCSVSCLRISVQILQIIMAVWCDVSLYKLACRLFGRKSARYALLCQLLCWFHFYTCTRTLINTLEAVLLTASVANWPWPIVLGVGESVHVQLSCSSKLAISLATLICYLRPSCAAFFITLTCFSANFFQICKQLAAFGTPVLLMVLVIDRIYFDDWVMPPWNFFHLNIVQNIASLYGVHSAHWYFTVCLPVTMLVWFPLSLYSILTLQAWRSPVMISALVYLTILSATPHKELRFIQALLPIFFCYAGHCLETMPKRGTMLKCVLFVAVLLNVPVALYTSLVHQRGALDAISYLSQDIASLHPNASVLFLTPCHTLPLYSHLHENITTRFLRCETIGALTVTAWEQDTFYQDPIQWVDTYALNATRPSYVLFFDSMEAILSPWLLQSGFMKAKEFFHTHFPEGRVGKYIVIYKTVPFV